MTNAKAWGIAVPVGAAAMTVLVTAAVPMSRPVENGLHVGVAIAVAQSLLSVWAMDRAWSTEWFYPVWGGGMLARMLIFAVVAFVAHKRDDLSLLATLLSMVTATTLFLVVEVYAFFAKKR